MMKKEIISGIYMITSPSGRIYIGQTINIFFRWHNYELYKCKAQRRLYNSLKKYGAKAHEFEILCECSEDELCDLETALIHFFDTFNTPHGLNLRSGGKHGKMSEETKKMLSIAHSGKKHTEEQNRKMGLTKVGNKNFLGRTHSDETKEAIRKKHIGKKLTEDTKKKIKEAMTGRVFSEETIRRMKASAGKHLKGKTLSAEHIEKIRKSLTGKKRPAHIIEMLKNRVPTQEHREAVSKSSRAYWAKVREEGGRVISDDEKLMRSEASKREWARRKALGLKRKKETKKRILSLEAIANRKVIAQRIKDHPDYNSEENRKKRHDKQVKAAQTKKDNIAKRIEQERLTMIF